MTMWLICKIICLLKIVCLFLQGTSSMIPFWSVVRVMDGEVKKPHSHFQCYMLLGSAPLNQ